MGSCHCSGTGEFFTARKAPAPRGRERARVSAPGAGQERSVSRSEKGWVCPAARDARQSSGGAGPSAGPAAGLGSGQRGRAGSAQRGQLGLLRPGQRLSRGSCSWEGVGGGQKRSKSNNASRGPTRPCLPQPRTDRTAPARPAPGRPPPLPPPLPRPGPKPGAGTAAAGWFWPARTAGPAPLPLPPGTAPLLPGHWHFPGHGCPAATATTAAPHSLPLPPPLPPPLPHTTCHPATTAWQCPSTTLYLYPGQTNSLLSLQA